jgi:hypothetical protein
VFTVFVFNYLQNLLAERGRFELPIALRLCLISSQVHSTGLCHLSAPSLPPELFSLLMYRKNAPAIERNLIHYSLNRSIVSPIYTGIDRRPALIEQIHLQLNRSFIFSIRPGDAGLLSTAIDSANWLTSSRWVRVSLRGISTTTFTIRSPMPFSFR